MSLGFVSALLEGSGMNDLLSRFLATIRTTLGLQQQVLYDYDEVEGSFDLLYFAGYPPDHRSELRKRLRALEISHALETAEPFPSKVFPSLLLVPLYFQETLEAVLVLETAGHSLTLDAPLKGLCRLISRFLGLFLSSSRLSVNQRIISHTLNDLQRAREVQLAYLPRNYPETEHYEIFGYNQSSALVGGDYFDYFCHRRKSVQCVVADACGHGLSAALIMSTFRGLMHSEVRRIGEEAALFTRLNRHLFTDGELLQYLTAVFLDYDEDSRILCHFNAGHFDPLLIHADSTFTTLAGGGPPLGMFPESEYVPYRTRSRPGDLLVLFTDGLVELRNRDENFFGMAGIREALLPNKDLPLKKLAETLLQQAALFSDETQPADDLTLFLMRFH